MKKENKQLAQRRKAEQKKKEKTKKIWKLIGIIGIPSILLLGIIIFCVSRPGTSSSNVGSDTYAVDTSYAIQNGDTVNIDYVGSIDGEVFEDTKGTGTQLTIGSGTYIDNFEEQLIGAKVGETVEVNVTFPENYTKELSGKDATFEVRINGVYK